MDKIKVMLLIANLLSLGLSIYALCLSVKAIKQLKNEKVDGE
ncbi:hypothetical protein NST63_18030 [Heyndrickxia sp. FSL W8-0496]